MCVCTVERLLGTTTRESSFRLKFEREFVIKLSKVSEFLGMKGLQVPS